MTSPITKKQNDVMLECRVSPRAKKSCLKAMRENALLISLKAPPVDGKANEELIRFLSIFFDLKRSAVLIERGHASRNKLVRLAGISIEAVISRINSITKG